MVLLSAVSGIGAVVGALLWRFVVWLFNAWKQDASGTTTPVRQRREVGVRPGRSSESRRVRRSLEWEMTVWRKWEKVCCRQETTRNGVVLTAIGRRSFLTYRTSFIHNHYWQCMGEVERESLRMGFVARVTTVDSSTQADGSLRDEEFKRQYPALFDYLAAGVWEDGTPRQTSTVLVFVEDGMVKGCLNDRANGRSLWMGAETVEGLLEALEEVLAAGKGTWRKNRDRSAPDSKKGGRR